MLTAARPTWTEKNVNSFLCSPENQEIIAFYLYNTPYKKASAQSISLSQYGWIETPSNENALIHEHIVEMLDGNVETPSKDEFDSIFESKSTLRFPNNTETQFAILLKSNSFCNTYFSHIRNAFAHGRFAEIKNENGKEVFILEDIYPANSDEVPVTARIVIYKENLINLMRFVKNNSNNETLLIEQFLDCLRVGHNKKSEIKIQLGITDTVYKHITEYLSSNRVIYSENNKWYEAEKKDDISKEFLVS